jgi:hypothetical protein
MITTNLSVIQNPVVNWIPKISMLDGRIIKLPSAADRSAANKEAEDFAFNLDGVDWTGVERVLN